MKTLTRFCNEKKNDDWKNISEFVKIKKNRSAEVKKKYVYVISWRTGKKAKCIDRLGDTDKFGILYIGRQYWSTVKFCQNNEFLE